MQGKRKKSRGLLVCLIALLAVVIAGGVWLTTTEEGRQLQRDLPLPGGERGGEPQAQEPVVPRDLRIVTAGDSLTYGYGDETRNGGYTELLRAGLEERDDIRTAVLDNFGVNSYRTDQLLKKLQQPQTAAKVREADLVVMTIGANDLIRVASDNFSQLRLSTFENALPAYQDRLGAVFGEIRRTNTEAQIVLMGIFNPLYAYFPDIPELDQAVAAWNAASREEAREHGVLFVPVEDLFRGQEQTLLAEDRFHPNSSGYRLMADRLLETLDQEWKREEKE